MTEKTVTIESDDILLEGTLTTPSQGSVQQAVLLIAGSGPLDRNQNNAHVQLNIFNAIAEHLAAHGIASLRYDKRGCGNSTGDFDAAGHFDLVADAKACTKFLQAHHSTQDALIYVLGHSEGSLIAPQLIADDKTLAGQILIAPFLEEFETLLIRQAESWLQEIAKLNGLKGAFVRFFVKFTGDPKSKQKHLIERVRTSTKPTLKTGKNVINAKWIRELMAIDPIAIHSAVTAPTLAIGGSKDLQCLPEDVNRLQQIVSGPIERLIIENMTHILRPDVEAPSIRNYNKLIQLPLDPQLLESITKWLKSVNNDNVKTYHLNT